MDIQMCYIINRLNVPMIAFFQNMCKSFVGLSLSIHHRVDDIEFLKSKVKMLASFLSPGASSWLAGELPHFVFLGPPYCTCSWGRGVSLHLRTLAVMDLQLHFSQLFKDPVSKESHIVVKDRRDKVQSITVCDA